MPSSATVERRILWLTVSNDDKLKRMRTDEWDEALAAPSDSYCEEGCLSGVTSPEG